MTSSIPFLETHFEEYIQSVEKYNLHPKIAALYTKHFPSKLSDLKNLIFYGPSGVGKYSNLLYALKRYSPSEMKYEKKTQIENEKVSYLMKMSDIHYEVDMALLGCNSKSIWNDIFFHIVDILQARKSLNKESDVVETGVIVCRNFHEIHPELLDNFFSYMQNTEYSSIKIVFFLLSEEISFIPENVLHRFYVIPFQTPTKEQMQTLIDATNTNTNNHTKTHPHLNPGIDNIKSLVVEYMNNNSFGPSPTPLQPTKSKSCSSSNANANPIPNLNPNYAFHNINQRILDFIRTYHLQSNIQFSLIREYIYDIFIYNLNVYACIWYIVKRFLKQNKSLLSTSQIDELFYKTSNIMELFHNNYRPIFHLEQFFLYLALQTSS